MIQIPRYRYIGRNSRFYEPKYGTHAEEIYELRCQYGIPADEIRSHKTDILVSPAENRNTLPRQGFKLHVSVRVDNIDQIGAIVMQYCVENRLSFKKMNRNDLSIILGRSALRYAAGKYITIYPPQERWMQIANELARLLRDFQGPTLWSARRIAESRVVHYRYGAFKGSTVKKPTAIRIETQTMLRSPLTGLLIEGSRSPRFSLPEGVEDPEPSDEPADAEITLKNGRYRIEKGLSCSNAGSIYLATDMQTRNRVVIKEQRPHVAIDTRGLDASERLSSEYETLKSIPVGIAPEPVEIFQQDGHRFLVMECIQGELLSKLQNPPLKRILEIGFWLAKALKKIHNAGYVMGDVTPANVFVLDAALAVRLIDFETSHAMSEPASGLRTPGFAPVNGSQAIVGGSSDIYGFGATLLYLTAPHLNTLLADYREAVDRYLRTAEDFNVIPAGFGTLLSECLADDPQRRPTAQALCNRIPRIAVTNLSTELMQTETEVLKTEPMMDPDRLRSEALQMMQYVQAVSDFSHTDHCFPSSPEAFETNQVSLAYGAAGTGHALHEIGHRLKDQAFLATAQSVKDWLKDWLGRHQSIHGAYPSETHVPPGLYIGRSGIACLMARLDEIDIGVDIMRSAIVDTENLKMPTGVFLGLSGVALASLWIHDKTGDPCFFDAAVEIRERIDDQSETSLGLRGTAGVALLDLALYTRGYGQGTACVQWVESIMAEASRIAKYPPGIYGRAGIVHTLANYYAHDAFKHPSLHDFILGVLPPSIDAYMRQVALPGIETAAGIGSTLLDIIPLFDGDARSDYLRTVCRIVDQIRSFAEYNDDGISIYEPKVATNLFSGSAGIALFYLRFADMLDSDASTRTTIGSPLTAIIREVL